MPPYAEINRAVRKLQRRKRSSELHKKSGREERANIERNRALDVAMHLVAELKRAGIVYGEGC